MPDIRLDNLRLPHPYDLVTRGGWPGLPSQNVLSALKFGVATTFPQCFQPLLSVYFNALWVLIYFGRPIG